MRMKTSKPLSSPLRQQGAVLIFSLVMLLLLTLLSVNMIQQNRLQFMMAANAQQQTETFSDAEDLLVLEENQIDAWHANYSDTCTTPVCRTAANNDVACSETTAMCAKSDGTKVACESTEAVSLPVYYSCNYAPTDTDTTREIDFKFTGTKSATNPVVLDQVYPCYTTDYKYTQMQASDVGVDPATPPPWTLSTNTLGLDANQTGTTTVSIVSVACLSAAGYEETCKYNNDGTFASDNNLCHSADQANCPTEIYTLQVVSRNANTSAQRTVESKYAVRCDAWADEL